MLNQNDTNRIKRETKLVELLNVLLAFLTKKCDFLFCLIVQRRNEFHNYLKSVIYRRIVIELDFVITIFVVFRFNAGHVCFVIPFGWHQLMNIFR